MRVSAFSVVVTAASVVLAVPAPLKRQADSAIICPAVDKKGSALSAKGSFVDEGNEFSQCVYPIAGTCSYFFADGTFSAGSSNCPVGLPQTVATGAGNAPTSVNAAGGGGGGQQTVTTTNTPPPVTTTSSTVAPAPPVTTQSTEAPPVTTQSTETPVVTSTSTTETPLTTSTSTPIVQPTSTSAPVVDTTTSAPAVATTPATTAPQTTVTENVNVTAAPTSTDSGTTPLGAASGNTNGAVVRHAGSALAVLPILCVLFSLL